MSKTNKSKILKRKTRKFQSADEKKVSTEMKNSAVEDVINSDVSEDDEYDNEMAEDNTVIELSSSSARFSRLSEGECDEDSDDSVVQGDGIEEVENMDELDDKLQKQKDDSSLDPKKFGLSDTKAKNIYCDNSELVEEIRKFQEENIATEKLGELIIKIGVHMTSMVRFWRYSISIKEELAQNAIMQMMRSVPKFSLKKDKSANKTPNAFGYMSMIAYRDMLHTLKKHFKQNKIRDAVADVYIGRLAEANSSDERIGMLRQTLERSEEFIKFLKNDKYPYQKKEVDMFALSKAEQKRRYKETLRRQSEEKKIGKRKSKRNTK